MKRVINKQLQKRRVDLIWPIVAVLIMAFAIPVFSNESARETQQTDPNAPRKILRGYKVDTSRRDEEGKFVRIPVYEGEPNEVPPVVPTAAKPKTSAAIEAGLQRITVDVGPELYSFKYKEPGYIEEEGIFYGVHFGYTVHDIVPAVPAESQSDRGAMYRAEGRFAFGRVDYDGALMDETPYRVNNVDDFTFEGRFLLGADILNEDTLSTLYSGIGYRYLNDDLSLDPAGYERESKYLYVPLGYQLDNSYKAGWSFGFGAEFDFFIFGNQRSHLSDFDPTYRDVDNRQNDGYGYRVSVRLRHKSKDAIFVVEPFFRYWDIDDSDMEYIGDGTYVLEPANETTEIGVQLYWMF
jgi:hypothetical protein